MQSQDIEVDGAGALSVSGLPLGVGMPWSLPGPDASFIDPLELETLGLILEQALLVHTVPHFYHWTQGMLQGLIPHAMLICALRNGDTGSFDVHCFSPSPGDLPPMAGLFTEDVGLVPYLLQSWEDQRYRPVAVKLADHPALIGNGLGRELTRQGCGDLLVHGTHDVAGRVESLFLFAAAPGTLLPRLAALAALVVPILHATWVHIQVSLAAPNGNSVTPASGTSALTPREQEIIGWIYRGKSNIEIGMILGISPLTVKNHVQKILRRLNVMNRAQAVGKVLSLHLLDSALLR